MLCTGAHDWGTWHGLGDVPIAVACHAALVRQTLHSFNAPARQWHDATMGQSARHVDRRAQAWRWVAPQQAPNFGPFRCPTALILSPLAVPQTRLPPLSAPLNFCAYAASGGLGSGHRAPQGRQARPGPRSLRSEQPAAPSWWRAAPSLRGRCCAGSTPAGIKGECRNRGWAVPSSGLGWAPLLAHTRALTAPLALLPIAGGPTGGPAGISARQASIGEPRALPPAPCTAAAGQPPRQQGRSGEARRGRASHHASLHRCHCLLLPAGRPRRSARMR